MSIECRKGPRWTGRRRIHETNGAERVTAQTQSLWPGFLRYWFRLLTLKKRLAKARTYSGVKLLRVLKGTGQ